MRQHRMPAWARWLLRVPDLPLAGPAMTGRASVGTGHGT